MWMVVHGVQVTVSVTFLNSLYIYGNAARFVAESAKGRAEYAKIHLDGRNRARPARSVAQIGDESEPLSRHRARELRKRKEERHKDIRLIILTARRIPTHPFTNNMFNTSSLDALKSKKRNREGKQPREHERSNRINQGFVSRNSATPPRFLVPF